MGNYLYRDKVSLTVDRWGRHFKSVTYLTVIKHFRATFFYPATLLIVLNSSLNSLREQHTHTHSLKCVFFEHPAGRFPLRVHIKPSPLYHVCVTDKH